MTLDRLIYETKKLADARAEIYRAWPPTVLATAYAQFIEDMVPLVRDGRRFYPIEPAVDPIVSTISILHSRIPSHLKNEGPFLTPIAPYFDEDLITLIKYIFTKDELLEAGYYPTLGPILKEQGAPNFPKTVEQYFSQTPIIGLTRAVTTVSLKEPRTDHFVMIAQQGSGKTTLLGAQLREYLSEPNPPAMIIIDPHSRFARELESLDYWREHEDQLVIVDPSAHPAINCVYTPDNLSEEAQSLITSTFARLFLAGAKDLSDNMSTMLQYMVRMLMLKHKAEGKVTLGNFLDLTKYKLKEDKAAKTKETARDHPDWKYMEQSGKYGADYWLNNFFDAGPTRDAVNRRFHSIAQDTTFCAMLDAETNQLDLWRFLHEEKRTVVVSGEGLGAERDTFLRFILLSVIQFAYSREHLPESECHPVIVFIDEAHRVITAHEADKLMNELRKFGIVLRCFTQQTSNFKDAFSTLWGQTRMILAGGDLDPDDVPIIAKKMECDPRFVKCPNPRDAKGRPTILNYTYWLSGKDPIRLHLPVKGPFPGWPKMDPAILKEKSATWRRNMRDPPPRSKPHASSADVSDPPRAHPQDEPPPSY